MGSFYQPRNQRLALLALLAVGALLLSVTWWTNRQSPDTRAVPGDVLALAADLRSQLNEGLTARNARGGQEAGAGLMDKGSGPAFPFDPNTISEDELLRLGLSPKQAASWLKYRGNRRDAFRRPEDIGKLFVLTEADKARLIPFARIADAPDRSTDYADAPSPTPGRPAAQRFPFDPNTLSTDSLQLLGLSAKQAAAFDKYRGYRERTFERPEDLLRFRAADPDLLAELQAFVTIAPPPAGEEGPATYGNSPARPPRPFADRPRPSEIAPGSFDINTTEAADWLILPGIGDYRAERIVKFREALGGFVDVEQVGTAYAIPDSLFRVIRPFLSGGGNVRQIAVNRATAEELYAHPYIGRKLAAVIVRYRDNHGPYADVADLSRIRILDAETRQRIAPYLDFSP